MRRSIRSLIFWLFFSMNVMMSLLCGCVNPVISRLYPQERRIEMEDSAKEEAIVEDSVEENTIEADTREKEWIYVHICGAVKEPGLYSFHTGSRIDDGIQAAGGFTKDAEEKSVNLAEFLQDGTQIIVKSKNDDSSGEASGTSTDSRINLNTADKNQLMTLNGIGSGRADAVIAYRDAHGGFASVDEILNVDGIGEGTYQKIKDTITIE